MMPRKRLYHSVCVLMAVMHGGLALTSECVLAQPPIVETHGRSNVKSQAQGSTMNDWFFMYNCDLGAGFVAVTVFPAGQSTVQLTQNLGEKAEIGFYSLKVPPADIDKIREVILQSAYQEIPAAKTLAPTTSTVALGEANGVAIPQMRVYPLPDLAKPLRTVVAGMDQLIEVIRQSPIRVLKGTGKPVSPQIPVGQPIALEVVLSNIGTQPIVVHNPLWREPSGTVLKLSLRKLMPGGATVDDRTVTVELPGSAVEFVSLTNTDEKPVSPKLEILAEGELKLRIKKSAYLAPGNYAAALTLHFVPQTIDPEKTIEGTLGIECGQLEITDGE